MAIIFRNGNYSDYDATKMRTAEPAVVLSGDPDTEDGKSVRIAFGSGTDKRLLTEDDLSTTILALIQSEIAAANS